MAKILVERYIIESNISPPDIKEIYREYVVIIDIILITLVGVLSIQMLSTATLRAFRNLANLLPALKGEAFGCNPDLVLQKINESLSKNFWRKKF
jgi:uncharacterized membrane protein